MSLYREVREWQQKLVDLMEYGEELAQRVQDLERQNINLKQRLVDQDYQSNGFEALTGLYDEGFHICPANFGQSRDDDCLFCLNFLLHKGRPHD